MLEERKSNASLATPRESNGFAVGNTVWSPCMRDGFRRCTIVSVDDASDSLFIGDRAGKREVRRTDVRPFYDSGPDFTCEDNTSLVHLDEANILDNLKRRFVQDKIYTYTANVLLAVNPYKDLSNLYSTARMWEYRGKPVGVQPPHPFAIADGAFRSLIRDKVSQALMVSGESGAGKTETAKIIMKYLTTISRTEAAHGLEIQEKIMNANPVLESFGNASTIRNLNSSRFGKYNKMYFNQVGTLTGAGIKTFLLESSRVVSQQDCEENYHVFYEMLAGLDEDRLDDLQLVPTHRYQLLYPGQVKALDQGSPQWARSKRNFDALRHAFSTIGIGSDVEEDVWDTVAALIHLGEVNFASSEEASEVQGDGSFAAPLDESTDNATQQSVLDVKPVEVLNRDNLFQAADLLGLKPYSLKEVLTRKKVRDPKGADFECMRSKTQSSQTLQSLIKILYQRLFDKIVSLINASSRRTNAAMPHSEPAPEDDDSDNHIGILDIYGFERLNSNGFEQLCINLANERLQQFFIEEVLQAEQRMYKEECLNISAVKLPDYQPVVNSIHEVMGILDEHSLRSLRNLGSNDPDQRFCEHVHRVVASDKRSGGLVTALKLKAKRNGIGLGHNDGFQIKHYAGEVPYTTHGWIAKNNDALVPEIESLLESSKKPFIKEMADTDSVCSIAGERVHSVAKKYLANLDRLLQTLKECFVHYIRCFNPNQLRQASVFDTKYVLEQINNCGTVELVRIMHHGYPHRLALQDLRRRFKDLLPKTMVENYSPRHFVLAIMMAFKIEESQWTLGTKRLFLKAGQLRILENLRDVGCKASKEMIWQIRVMFARRRVRAAFQAVTLVRWLPGHMRRKRRDLVAKKLRKVVFIFVRLHRWLRKARKTRYGTMESTKIMQQDLDQHSLRLAWCLPLGENHERPSPPNVFIAQNHLEMVDEKSAVPNDMLLKVAQGNMSESVLFYDGRSIVSARLSGRAFQRQAGQSHGHNNARADEFEDGLSDVRCVDPYGSLRAEPSGTWSGGNIACMCQHKEDRQIFAAVDVMGRGVVWRWLGTRSNEPNKKALNCLGQFWVPASLAVLQMCFLCGMPEELDADDGYVIALVCGKRERQWLEIDVVSVHHNNRRSGYATLAWKTVGLDTSLPLNAEQVGVQINFVQTSTSDRILVLGGVNMLQFYAINVSGGKLDLALINDCAETYPDEIGESNMTICMGSPVPNDRVFDWVVVGDSQGKIYGFQFDVGRDGAIKMNMETTGRFRTNTHDRGKAVSALISTYGASSDAHIRAIKDMGVTYSMYLNHVKEEDKTFYSLGDNGRLLLWRYVAPTGWKNAEEVSVSSHVSPNLPAAPSQNNCMFVGGHASRLVPHILVLVDIDRHLMMCYDRISREIAAVCSCAHGGSTR
mmetsp:Transcript_106958/g.300800  ORF Transcript_106958/g.300800 Transcript_106958/m.300800 type:complete len:1392 (-) Transcript_106958:85-4260(-)